MSDAPIAVTKATDFTGLRLTQSASGHVHSPWFSFDVRLKPGEHIYDMQSHYHVIMDQAKSAFSVALGVPADDIIVTSLHDFKLLEIRWRLGTKNPCKLPTPLKPALKNPLSQGAIEL